MGASYANAPDGAATGASSFYTLVVLTLYLAFIVPILLTRLAKGNKNVTTVALAVSCAGSFVAFKRVHPAAVAWADASSSLRPLRHPPDPVDGQRDRRQEGLPLALADGTSGQGGRCGDLPQDPERARGGLAGDARRRAGTTGTSATRTGRGRPSRASRCRTASRRRPLGCTC